MAEFCESCPMRGTAGGNIEGLLSSSATYRYRSGACRTIEAALVIGANNGTSEPVVLPTGTIAGDTQAALDVITGWVESCKKPVTGRVGRILRRDASICPALGWSALKDNRLARHLFKLAAIHL